MLLEELFYEPALCHLTSREMASAQGIALGFAGDMLADVAALPVTASKAGGRAYLPADTEICETAPTCSKCNSALSCVVQVQLYYLLSCQICSIASSKKLVT